MSDFLSNVGNVIKDATMSPLAKMGAEAAENLKDNPGGIFVEIKDATMSPLAKMGAEAAESLFNEAHEFFDDTSEKLSKAIEENNKTVEDALQDDKDKLVEGYNKIKEAIEPKTELGKGIKEKATDFINKTMEHLIEQHKSDNPLDFPDIDPNSGGNI